MSIYILDTETTGLTNSAQVIELGWIELPETPSPFLLALDSVSKRYLPTVAISSEAYSVHQITYRELLGNTSSRLVQLPEDVEYLIGHNIQFDARVLKQSNPSLAHKLDKVKFICTQRLAKILLPKYGVKPLNYKQDNLIKELYPDSWVETITSPVHDALSDCYKTKRLLEALLRYCPNVTSWVEIYNKQHIVFPKETDLSYDN